jgi:hypothetical protein
MAARPNAPCVLVDIKGAFDFASRNSAVAAILAIPELAPLTRLFYFLYRARA